MIVDPWTGTHDDRPDWDGGWDVDAVRTLGTLVGLVVAAWAVPVAAAWWAWRALR